jgi:hypothetical protein
MNNSVITEQPVALREKVVILTPSVSQWYGATTMGVNDFRCDVDELPPERARKNLGAKYLINPEALKPFRKLRKRFFTVLNEAGIADPVLKGSYFIPIQKADEVIGKLRAISTEYEAEADSFADRYTALTQEWALENPEFSTQILAAGMTKGKVRSRFGCSFAAFKMNPIPGQEQEVEDRVKGLIGPILREASEAAREALKTYIKDQDNGTHRMRTKIVKIVDKLESMSALNGNLYSLVEKLRPLIARLPEKATRNGYKGENFFTAFTCLHVLASEELMQAVAEGKADLSALSESLRLEREEERRINAPENGLLAPAVIKAEEESEDPLDALW